jgi:hypothetical protein
LFLSKNISKLISIKGGIQPIFLNGYIYALNNPIKNIDIDGHIPIIAIVLIVFIIPATWVFMAVLSGFINGKCQKEIQNDAAMALLKSKLLSVATLSTYMLGVGITVGALITLAMFLLINILQLIADTKKVYCKKEN